MDQPYYGPFDYHPGQNVQARQNDNWVPAHIINPNLDGTYDIIIGRSGHFGWPANNLRRDPNDRRQREPFNIPQPDLINTDLLNRYGAEWFRERGDAAEHFLPENRINDFVNFVSERYYANANRNLSQENEQRIRDYANQHFNEVFGDEYNPSQTAGAKRRRNRKTNKRRKTRKTRRSKKRRRR